MNGSCFVLLSDPNNPCCHNNSIHNTRGLFEYSINFWFKLHFYSTASLASELHKIVLTSRPTRSRRRKQCAERSFITAAPSSTTQPVRLYGVLIYKIRDVLLEIFWQLLLDPSREGVQYYVRCWPVRRRVERHGHADGHQQSRVHWDIIKRRYLAQTWNFQKISHTKNFHFEISNFIDYKKLQNSEIFWKFCKII